MDNGGVNNGKKVPRVLHPLTSLPTQVPMPTMQSWFGHRQTRKKEAEYGVVTVLLENPSICIVLHICVLFAHHFLQKLPPRVDELKSYS